MDKPFHIFLILLLLVSCSPKVDTPVGSALESAISLYISGRYEEASEQFDRLRRSLPSEEGRLEAYLYLGRCYEAMGRYQEAADAYTEGMMIGGAAPFQDHIDRLRVRFEADPAYAQKHPHLTRAQLACLIRGMILPGAVAGSPRTYAQDGPALSVTPSDIASHWAKESIELLLDAGVMVALPDSLFHPDAKVTKAAFYFIVQRIRQSYSWVGSEDEELFPNGFEALLRSQLEVLQEKRPEADAYISGSEAVSVLNRLKKEWDIPHG
jgi:tetratricopeptide (TPR) repeat protein